MEGAECQLSSALVGAFHSFHYSTPGICVFLVKNLVPNVESIIRASDTPHMWNLRTFADFIGLVQLHSKL